MISEPQQNGLDQELGSDLCWAALNTGRSLQHKAGTRRGCACAAGSVRQACFLPRVTGHISQLLCSSVRPHDCVLADGMRGTCGTSVPCAIPLALGPSNDMMNKLGNLETWIRDSGITTWTKPESLNAFSPVPHQEMSTLEFSIT